MTQAEADAANALLVNQEQGIGYSAAIYTSINRAQGAYQAGDSYWEGQQTQALNLYETQLAPLLDAEPALLANLQSALKVAGFVSIKVTPSEVFNFESDIATNGLSATDVQTLTDLGADADEITAISDTMIVQDPNAVAGSFPELLTNPTLVSALHQAASALRSDPTPPPAADVSSQVRVTRGGFRYNLATGRYVQRVTLTNVSGKVINGPVTLVLDSLNNATLNNETGTTVSAAPLDSPYIAVNLGNNPLGSGQSASVNLEFVDNSGLPVSYTTQVLAGTGSL